MMDITTALVVCVIVIISPILLFYIGVFACFIGVSTLMVFGYLKDRFRAWQKTRQR